MRTQGAAHSHPAVQRPRHREESRQGTRRASCLSVAFALGQGANREVVMAPVGNPKIKAPQLNADQRAAGPSAALEE